MKKGFLILVMSVLAISINAQTKENIEATFSVPLDCQNCVDKVEKNIAFEKGVKAISCNIEKKEVVVTYRADKTDIEQLKKGFAKIGYKDVTVVEGEKQMSENEKKSKTKK